MKLEECHMVEFNSIGSNNKKGRIFIGFPWYFDVKGP
jgi:hypothetical protein